MTSRSNEVAVNTNSNSDANTNTNTAPANDNTTDITSNLPPSDVNANANTSENINGNTNLNLNANTRPSPSPRTSPSASPTPRNANRNANEDQPAVDEPPPTPTPVRPTPAPTQQGTRTIGGGVVNGRATSLPKPSYPSNARSVRAEGQVNVQVLIDENGNVTSASAISGHALLRPAAASAARQAKFSPTVVNGQPVRVSGVIVYNFILNQ
jgi:TonB family protein